MAEGNHEHPEPPSAPTPPAPALPSEDQLTDLVAADLVADGFTVTTPPPPPAAAPPPTPTGTQTQRIPDWVERLADVMALIVSAFAIMQAGSWFGKDNFIVAIAIGAAIVFLAGNYNGPLRQFLRAIFTELILTIVTLVEAIGKFFEAANKYYGGNFARMVIELILVPIALGLVGEFLKYPAIQDLVKFLQDVIAEARKLAQDAIDLVQKGIGDLQAFVDKTVGDVLAFLPAELGRFKTAIMADLDRFFTAADRRLARVEDRVTAGLADVTAFVAEELLGVKFSLQLFGIRLDLLPEVTRQYLLGLLAGAATQPVALPAPEEPAGPPVPAAVQAAIDQLTADLEAAAAGTPGPLGQAVQALVGEIADHAGVVV